MTARTWPGPGELADYLVGKRKAKEQFANGVGGRCCLGHYADMCGLSYPNEQPDFSGAADDDDYVGLPANHWLRAKPSKALKALVVADAPPAHVTYVPYVDSALAYLNDHAVGFDKVIEALRKLAAKP